MKHRYGLDKVWAVALKDRLAIDAQGWPKLFARRKQASDFKRGLADCGINGKVVAVRVLYDWET
jgi:hypothetical protein